MSDGTRQLCAGPLTMELDQGGLRYLRLGDREVLRRVYVAVRDTGWATIPIEISDLTLESRGDAFAVDFVADHCQGGIHFRWKGTLRGDPRGTVSFLMDGRAITTFMRNRIGICVLHPIEECAGRPTRLEKVDGKVVEGPFPRLIAPNQPFMDIRAFGHEVEPGLWAELRFEGDVFEMEDQRNWCDASYKTYSTPLALPRPVEIETGTRLRQWVTLSLVPGDSRKAVRRQAEEITLALAEGAGAPLPRLGTALGARREPLTDRERERLRALRLAHLRVDLVPGREDAPAALEHAIAEARALALPLEIALAVPAVSPEAGLDRLAAALKAARPAVARLLVLPLEGEATAPSAVAAVRAAVSPALSPDVPVGAGSNVYFTEANRNRGVVEAADLVCFPNSPQIHMDDDATIVENLEPLSWIGETARSFAGPRPLALGPITLKPQPRPGPVLGGEDRTAIPPHVDVRQASLLAAGWTACHVGRAAHAGFAAATYYQATGWLGLMYGESGARFPAAFPGAPGEVFPVYHLLADVGEMAASPEARVLPSRSSRPLDVDAVVLRQGGRTRALVANFTARPQTVRLPGALAGGPVRRLHAGNAHDAARSPEAFRAARSEERAGERLALAPHEVVRIDVGH